MSGKDPVLRVGRGSGIRKPFILTPRRHARFSISLPIRCTPLAGRARRDWRGSTANVGGGGLAVELPMRLRPGTRLRVEIRTAIGPISVEADVLWTRRMAGHVPSTRHGLCLADRSEILDLPVGVLLGQWLQAMAREKATDEPHARFARRTRPPRRSR